MECTSHVFDTFFVDYFGVGASCCLGVMVAGYWLCHFGQQQAVCCALAPVAEVGAMTTKTITLSMAW